MAEGNTENIANLKGSLSMHTAAAIQKGPEGFPIVRLDLPRKNSGQTCFLPRRKG
ncbi:hypothetical protein KKG52_02780 [Patescibacteria group bacterium]|nr:hypothetical protein [Patescibacteria group bacterium]